MSLGCDARGELIWPAIHFSRRGTGWFGIVPLAGVEAQFGADWQFWSAESKCVRVEWAVLFSWLRAAAADRLGFISVRIDR